MKSLLLFLAGFVAVISHTAVAAPHLTNDKPLSLDLNGVSARDVLALVADVTRTNMVVHDCAREKIIDLKLTNTPASVILDVLAARISLTYTEQGGVILVSCQESARPDPRLQRRITLAVQALPLDDVLGIVANASGLTWAGCADCREAITLTLPNVRVQTVLGVLSDATGRVFSVQEGELRLPAHATPE